MIARPTDLRVRRIAMVAACPYPVPQGSQVLLRDTAQALRDRGHDVHLVVYGYGAGEEDASREGAPAPGLSVHRCVRIPGAGRIAAGPSLGKPLLDCAMVVTLRRVVRREGIQIVHAHNYEGLLVALAAGARPIVYHGHNAMGDELPYYFHGSRLARSVGAWLDRTFPRRADHAIAPHAALAEHLVACGCAPGAVTVVAPPAPLAAFDPPGRVELPLDQSRGSAPLPPVLYTGNLDAYQNLGLLQAVMLRVRSARPEARLRIATTALRALPGAEVVPTPTFAALRQVLSEESIVVVPRISWSGYPIKILNAMAAGQAIVACRSSAHPLEDGRDGLVVPDDDAEAFAAAVLRLMGDTTLRRRLGQAARRTAEERHAPTLIAAALEAVYARLLPTGSGNPQ